MEVSELINVLNSHDVMFLDTYLQHFKDNKMALHLLEIFCYGKWSDYSRYRKLPGAISLEPTSFAFKKLKYLTLLSMFAKNKELTFEEMMDETCTDNVVDLENAICDMIGMGLLKALIDEKHRIVKCSRCASRCIPDTVEDVENIVKDIESMRQKIKQLEQ